MQGLAIQTSNSIASSYGKRKLSFLNVVDSLPSRPSIPTRNILPSSFSYSSLLLYTKLPKLHRRHSRILPYASDVDAGSGSFEESQGNEHQKFPVNQPSADGSSKFKSLLSQILPSGIPYHRVAFGVLCVSALMFSLHALTKGGPSSLIAVFSLIFVSKIGDKTFFIAALLAMQYKRVLVLLGSMGALSLMTVLSVVIGWIFHWVPAQFQTTLPMGEYAAVALLFFLGFKSIQDTQEKVKTAEKSSQELDEFAEAEELVKEKASKLLTNPLEILWKSFSLVFFAEWGDRSLLARSATIAIGATIALGAAQSPWGGASGAIAGHLAATSVAILGGEFLADYISEKRVGYLCRTLYSIILVMILITTYLRWYDARLIW